MLSILANIIFSYNYYYTIQGCESKPAFALLMLANPEPKP